MDEPPGRMPPAPLETAVGTLRRDGSTVRLREATLADAPILDARDADPAMGGEFNDLGPRPGPRRPVADLLADGGRLVGPERGRLLVERLRDGQVIGDVSWHAVMYGPNERSRALNVGIALYPEARGHGHGAEAQRLLAELLFAHFPIERVEAGTDIDNIAEQRSLEKAGFTREGVLRRSQFRAGSHHDLVGYSILRAEVGPPGAEIGPPDEVLTPRATTPRDAP
ncbi:MAG TPA: GNAT family protein [Candidatus Limnocylindrales bacterium]|nr:GNAT family protein [Candidatus Limnocylindrales bacterium]